MMQKFYFANEVTKLCHGKEAAVKAHNSAQDTFEKGKLEVSIPPKNSRYYSK